MNGARLSERTGCGPCFFAILRGKLDFFPRASYNKEYEFSNPILK